MVGHAIPGVVGLQDLHGHLSLLQQFTDEDRDQILGFLRIARYFFLKELFASSICSSTSSVSTIVVPAIIAIPFLHF